MTAPPAVARIENASAFRRGLLVWYPIAGGIVAWLAHLTFLASTVRWASRHDGGELVLHGATLVCAAATLLGLLLARRLVAAAGDASEAGLDDAGQLLFLGRLGLLVSAINLALIILEGFYVVVLPVR